MKNVKKKKNNKEEKRRRIHFLSKRLKCSNTDIAEKKMLHRKTNCKADEFIIYSMPEK